VDAAQPPPAICLATAPEVVGAGVGRHVSCVHGDHRYSEAPRRRAAARAKHDRAGQVHNVSSVVGDGGLDPRARQPYPEARVERQTDSWHPRDRELGAERGNAPRRRGRDDEWLMAAPHELLSNPQRGTRDSVDIRRK
jgi:hypothetical protein